MLSHFCVQAKGRAFRVSAWVHETMFIHNDAIVEYIIGTAVVLFVIKESQTWARAVIVQGGREGRVDGPCRETPPVRRVAVRQSAQTDGSRCSTNRANDDGGGKGAS